MQLNATIHISADSSSAGVKDARSTPGIVDGQFQTQGIDGLLPPGIFLIDTQLALGIIDFTAAEGSVVSSVVGHSGVSGNTVAQDGDGLTGQSVRLDDDTVVIRDRYISCIIFKPVITAGADIVCLIAICGAGSIYLGNQSQPVDMAALIFTNNALISLCAVIMRGNVLFIPTDRACMPMVVCILTPISVVDMVQGIHKCFVCAD